jgi:hypothetical protein
MVMVENLRIAVRIFSISSEPEIYEGKLSWVRPVAPPGT